MTPLLVLLLVLAAARGPILPGVAAEEADTIAECDGWASAGECSLNPRYMLENCPVACKKQAAADREMAREIEEKIGHITSFFELDAEDIDEKVTKFEQFKGKVTVVTNVASYCGYTESHYRGLVQLYNQFKGSPIGFNILAFPCNQFGEQEPEQCPKIKRFAKSKGVEFTMMNKVDVNGIDAHPVYHYLKKVAGPPAITWNFATYYIITPGGVVTSHSGVEPKDLVPHILEAMGADESSGDDDDEGKEL
ncbi:hypothetical protein ACHAXT_004206 [Thalassiosira profunda]